MLTIKLSIVNMPKPSGRTTTLRDDAAFNRNENQKILLGRKARPVRKIDNLTAISEPIV
jgi:hypothetical protein